ncbi:SbtA family thio(seleno)oxazole RiPP natural product precursor [Desulfonatronum thioautotrophicum]|uniref:SbtA family thio(seleno)oxazole RiPP natural product precursor n=1 Tax=Desulfonatronum thioautotrophicum TaxID=617001 RepID=UPI0005EB0BFE|nr:SbtA family thio(seleno)oxazole RiPP natural product precursor [Desulfonatronum thioautotrophicum]
MESKDVKTYLAGLCLAAMLTGGGFAAPGVAFGSGSGCSTNGAKAEVAGDGADEEENGEPIEEPDEEVSEEPEGSGA